jgi:hypothetical protein
MVSRELRALFFVALCFSVSMSGEAHADTPPEVSEAEYPAQGCAGEARCREVLSPASIEPHVRNHDGFFLRAGAGGTLYHGKFGDRGRETELSVSEEVLLGGTPWRGIVIGGGVLGVSLSSTAHPLIAYSAFAQWYPDPRRGLHLQALAAFAIVETSSDVLGPLAAVGAGYDFFISDQLSLGAFGRLGYAEGFGPSSTRVSIPFASLAATFTWH